MFKNLSILRKRSYGLMMVLQGMDVQIEYAKHYIKSNSIPEDVKTDFEARLKILEYWREEIRKAYDGELC